MKLLHRFLLLFVLLLGFAPLAVTTTPAEGDSPELEYKPGEILVKFHTDVRSADAGALRQDVQGAFMRTLYASPVELWQVPAGAEQAAVDQLNADPRVEIAELNVRYQALGAPNDPRFSSQWAHDIMNSEDAWEYTTGSAGVVIAVLDSGIDSSHPDLSGKVVAGWDFVDDDSTPNDQNGHGTHVAGIAAASTNNGIGVAGMSWQAQVMPVRVLDNTGSGYNSDILDGITWAASHGADIINLSLGGTTYSSIMQTAVNSAHSGGSLVVAAMGNCRVMVGSCPSTNPTMYPAAYNNVMAVAATDPADHYTSYSQYGAHCDVAAPGGEMTAYHDPNGILSTMPTSPVFLTVNYGYSTGYDQLQGTSQAAPYVSGLAALVWALAPTLSNDQVQSLIEQAAEDLGPTGWDPNYGYGRIDALAALKLLTVSNFVITDAVESPGSLEVSFAWEEPLNIANTYEIKSHSAPITEANWSSATTLTDTLPGTAETYTTTIAYTGETRYFAIKAVNSSGDRMPISNLAFWPQQNVYLPIVIK